MEISICIEIIQYLLRMTACLINTTLCLFFASILQVFATIGIITIIGGKLINSFFRSVAKTCSWCSITTKQSNCKPCLNETTSLLHA